MELMQPFHIIDNPGVYSEDPVWKRYWKVEGIRAVNPDGTIITDAMERFRQAFELGVHYMAEVQLKRNAELRELVSALQNENDLLAVTNRSIASELSGVKKSLKNYEAAIESL